MLTVVTSKHIMFYKSKRNELLNYCMFLFIGFMDEREKYTLNHSLKNKFEGKNMKNQYHHGNLKKDLLETSIRIISQEGFDHLSLRNISSKCGVSHNAIYRHFDNKEQLIHACQEYVTLEFTNYLNSKLDNNQNTYKNIKLLSFAYIEFYLQHPTYYSFMYRNSYIKIEFTMDEKKGNYPPYNIFRNQYEQLCKNNQLSQDEAKIRIVRLWSLLHGITAFIISNNVQWNNDWKSCLENEFK